MLYPIARATLLAFAGSPLVVHAAAASSARLSAESPAAVSAASAASATPSSSSSTASADASFTALSPVVVTAERGPQTLADTIPQTSLFDQQDIADTSATDLPGLLQLAPGAQISRTGGPGSTASVYLRGASSTQTLLLIDGVRVDSVSLGAPQLGQIPLEQIDHVEVVNGNVSALYGSGAIGGVVQVFTKDGGDHPPRFDFSLGYGSYHTQTQQAGVNGALDKDAARASASHLRARRTTAFRRSIRSRRPTPIRTRTAI